MRVTFIRNVFAPGGVRRRPGDADDLPESMARDLIRVGKAVVEIVAATPGPDAAAARPPSRKKGD
jgi:hypothetical protein